MQTLLQQLPVAPTAIIQENPSIVQVIMPFVDLQSTVEPSTEALVHEPLAVHEPVTAEQPPPPPPPPATDDDRELVEATTIAPNITSSTTTMLSNFIQTSHTPLGVLTRIAPAVAAFEPSASALQPVSSIAISNSIQSSLDDELLAELPPPSVEHSHAADAEAAAFADIQPSDIVTLPDPLPPLPAVAAMLADPPKPPMSLPLVLDHDLVVPKATQPELSMAADEAAEPDRMDNADLELPPLPVLPEQSRSMTEDETAQT